MDYFLPSEVARLVLGYLKEEKCMQTYQSFLAECCHLSEYTSLLQRGREYSTLLWGKTLIQILNEFAESNVSSQHGFPVNHHEPRVGGVIQRKVVPRVVQRTPVGMGFTVNQRTRTKAACSTLRRAPSSISPNEQPGSSQPMVSLLPAVIKTPARPPLSGTRLSQAVPVELRSEDDQPQTVIDIQVSGTTAQIVETKTGADLSSQMLTASQMPNITESDSLPSMSAIKSRHLSGKTKDSSTYCVERITNQLLGNSKVSSISPSPVSTSVLNSSSSVKRGTDQVKKSDKKKINSTSKKSKVKKSKRDEGQHLSESDNIHVGKDNVIASNKELDHIDFLGDEYSNAESDLEISSCRTMNPSITVLKNSEPQSTSTPIVAQRQIAEQIFSPRSLCGSSPRLKICGVDSDHEVSINSVHEVESRGCGAEKGNPSRTNQSGRSASSDKSDLVLESSSCQSPTKNTRSSSSSKLQTPVKQKNPSLVLHTPVKGGQKAPPDITLNTPVKQSSAPETPGKRPDSTLHTPVKQPEAPMMQLRTPIKSLLDNDARLLAAIKSPRRKGPAPKRRSFGEPLVGSKPMIPPPPVFASKPVSCSADNSNSSEAITDDYKTVPLLLEELINNFQLAERLAENINRVKETKHNISGGSSGRCRTLSTSSSISTASAALGSAAGLATLLVPSAGGASQLDITKRKSPDIFIPIENVNKLQTQKEKDRSENRETQEEHGTNKHQTRQDKNNIQVHTEHHRVKNQGEEDPNITLIGGKDDKEERDKPQSNTSKEGDDSFTEQNRSTTPALDLDSILGLGEESQMPENAIQDIIEMTRNDPDFDSLFNMFHTDKNAFIEKEYGVAPPSSTSDTKQQTSFEGTIQSLQSDVQSGINRSSAVIQSTNPLGGTPMSTVMGKDTQFAFQTSNTGVSVSTSVLDTLSEAASSLSKLMQERTSKTDQTAKQIISPPIEEVVQQAPFISPSRTVVAKVRTENSMPVLHMTESIGSQHSQKGAVQTIQILHPSEIGKDGKEISAYVETVQVLNVAKSRSTTPDEVFHSQNTSEEKNGCQAKDSKSVDANSSKDKKGTSQSYPESYTGMSVLGFKRRKPEMSESKKQAKRKTKSSTSGDSGSERGSVNGEVPADKKRSLAPSNLMVSLLNADVIDNVKASKKTAIKQSENATVTKHSKKDAIRMKHHDKDQKVSSQKQSQVSLSQHKEELYGPAHNKHEMESDTTKVSDLYEKNKSGEINVLKNINDSEINQNFDAEYDSCESEVICDLSDKTTLAADHSYDTKQNVNDTSGKIEGKAMPPPNSELRRSARLKKNTSEDADDPSPKKTDSEITTSVVSKENRLSKKAVEEHTARLAMSRQDVTVAPSSLVSCSVASSEYTVEDDMVSLGSCDRSSVADSDASATRGRPKGTRTKKYHRKVTFKKRGEYKGARLKRSVQVPVISKDDLPVGRVLIPRERSTSHDSSVTSSDTASTKSSPPKNEPRLATSREQPTPVSQHLKHVASALPQQLPIMTHVVAIPASQKANSGQVTTVTNQQASSDQVTKVTNQQGSSGQVTTVANQQVNSGQVTTVANQQVNSGQVTTVANQQVATGQTTSSISGQQVDPSQSVSNQVVSSSPQQLTSNQVISSVANQQLISSQVITLLANQQLTPQIIKITNQQQPVSSLSKLKVDSQQSEKAANKNANLSAEKTKKVKTSTSPSPSSTSKTKSGKSRKNATTRKSKKKQPAREEDKSRVVNESSEVSLETTELGASSGSNEGIAANQSGSSDKENKGNSIAENESANTSVAKERAEGCETIDCMDLAGLLANHFSQPSPEDADNKPPTPAKKRKARTIKPKRRDSKEKRELPGRARSKERGRSSELRVGGLMNLAIAPKRKSVNVDAAANISEFVSSSQEGQIELPEGTTLVQEPDGIRLIQVITEKATETEAPKGRKKGGPKKTGMKNLTVVPKKKSDRTKSMKLSGVTKSKSNVFGSVKVKNTCAELLRRKKEVDITSNLTPVIVETAASPYRDTESGSRHVRTLEFGSPSSMASPGMSSVGSPALHIVASPMVSDAPSPAPDINNIASPCIKTSSQINDYLPSTPSEYHLQVSDMSVFQTPDTAQDKDTLISTDSIESLKGRHKAVIVQRSSNDDSDRNFVTQTVEPSSNMLMSYSAQTLGNVCVYSEDSMDSVIFTQPKPNVVKKARTKIPKQQAQSNVKNSKPKTSLFEATKSLAASQKAKRSSLETEHEDTELGSPRTEAEVAQTLVAMANTPVKYRPVALWSSLDDLLPAHATLDEAKLSLTFNSSVTSETVYESPIDTMCRSPSMASSSKPSTCEAPANAGGSTYETDHTNADIQPVPVTVVSDSSTNLTVKRNSDSKDNIIDTSLSTVPFRENVGTGDSEIKRLECSVTMATSTTLTSTTAKTTAETTSHSFSTLSSSIAISESDTSKSKDIVTIQQNPITVSTKAPSTSKNSLETQARCDKERNDSRPTKPQSANTPERSQKSAKSHASPIRSSSLTRLIQEAIRSPMVEDESSLLRGAKRKSKPLSSEAATNSGASPNKRAKLKLKEKKSRKEELFGKNGEKKGGAPPGGTLPVINKEIKKGSPLQLSNMKPKDMDKFLFKLHGKKSTNK